MQWQYTAVSVSQFNPSLLSPSPNSASANYAYYRGAIRSEFWLRRLAHTNPSLPSPPQTRRLPTMHNTSGGPLMNADAEVQIGLTSYGGACLSGLPGVYVRVSAYQDWIESVAGSLDS